MIKHRLKLEKKTGNFFNEPRGYMNKFLAGVERKYSGVKPCK